MKHLKLLITSLLFISIIPFAFSQQLDKAQEYENQFEEILGNDAWTATEYVTDETGNISQIITKNIKITDNNKNKMEVITTVTSPDGTVISKAKKSKQTYKVTDKNFLEMYSGKKLTDECKITNASEDQIMLAKKVVKPLGEYEEYVFSYVFLIKDK